VSQSHDVEAEELSVAKRLLGQARAGLRDPAVGVDKLYSLAHVRYGLCVTAKYVHYCVVERSRPLTPEVRRLIDAAAEICEQGGTKWPK
jgi:hypothetical protein